MPNARYAAFIVWICGGASFTTALLCCISRFKAVDASFTTMINFGACPTFSNVLYKTSYACNMSVSLLVLMGSTKISFV